MTNFRQRYTEFANPVCTRSFASSGTAIHAMVELGEPPRTDLVHNAPEGDVQLLAVGGVELVEGFL